MQKILNQKLHAKKKRQLQMKSFSFVTVVFVKCLKTCTHTTHTHQKRQPADNRHLTVVSTACLTSTHKFAICRLRRWDSSPRRCLLPLHTLSIVDQFTHQTIPMHGECQEFVVCGTPRQFIDNSFGDGNAILRINFPIFSFIRTNTFVVVVSVVVAVPLECD